MGEDSQAPGLRQNKNWRLLWLGQAVSVVGDMVFYVTVLLWIATVIAKGEPWAPAAASGALIATAGPVLVVGPLAGVFVDRWNRRRIMLTADAARFVLILCLLLVPVLRQAIGVGGQLAFVYSVLAVCSCFGGFFDPSRLAVMGEIVPPRDQPKASGQLTAAFSLAQIIGPPIAAPLLFTVGVQWALILNAASFAVSFACVRAIALPPEPADETPAPDGFVAEFRAGIKFFAGSRILIALALGIVLAMLGNGAVNSLAVFFIPANLHLSASWIGAIIGSVGAGAIAGALLTGRLATHVKPPQLFWLSLIGCGVALIGFSRATGLAVALIFAVLLGVAVGVLNAVVSPILLSVAPARMLGRVSAVLSPLQQLASIVSMALAGALASTVLRGFHADVAGVTFGPYDTVFLAGGVLFVLGGLAAIAPMRSKESPAAAAGAVAEQVAAQTGGDGPALAPTE
jgi:MFS family permease